MTQENNILQHLRSGRKLNPLQALKKYGCFRLASRIFGLKSQGINVKSKLVTRNGKTFSEYSL